MKNLLYLLFVLTCTAACKKEIDELPPATETGANKFGARVDGALWVPQKFGVMQGTAILEARYTGTGGVFINARNFASSPTETEFELYIQNITGPGTYQLNTNTAKFPNATASYGYYIKRKLMPQGEWITNSQQTGSITITKYDTVSHILSGSFAFTAASIDNTASPLEVTEGRFDIKVQ